MNKFINWAAAAALSVGGFRHAILAVTAVLIKSTENNRVKRFPLYVMDGNRTVGRGLQTPPEGINFVF